MESAPARISLIDLSKQRAFIKSAPPAVPGSPANCSAPEKIRSVQNETNDDIEAPAPQETITLPSSAEEDSVRISLSPAVEITAPSKPSSETIRLLPPPRIKTLRSFSPAMNP